MTARFVLALALTLTLGVPAARAGPAGFSDPETVPGSTTAKSPPALATNSRGDAAIAWEQPSTRDEPPHNAKVFISRRARSERWSAPEQLLAGNLADTSGLSVVIDEDGTTFVAVDAGLLNGEDSDQQVLAGAARAGQPFVALQRLARTPYLHSFLPKLTRTGDRGAAVLWRGIRRVRTGKLRRPLLLTVVEPGSSRFGAPRTLGQGGLPSAIASAADGTIVAGWMLADARQGVNALRIAVVSADASRTIALTRSARGGLRLATQGPTVVAGWTRGDGHGVAFRRLLPASGPTVASPAPAIEQQGRLAVGPDGQVVYPYATRDGVFVATGPGASVQLVSGARSSGVPYAAITPDGAAFVAVRRGGETLIHVRSPGTSAFTAEPFAPGLTTGAGNTFAFGAVGDAMVAAWKQRGGLRVVTRP